MWMKGRLSYRSMSLREERRKKSLEMRRWRNKEAECWNSHLLHMELRTLLIIGVDRILKLDADKLQIIAQRTLGATAEGPMSPMRSFDRKFGE